MKEPKNIETLNKMVTYYITLHGLRGETLNKMNPFSIYFTRVALQGNIFNLMSPTDGLVQQRIDYTAIVPTDTVHELINEAYHFYKSIDSFDSTISPEMKNIVISQIGGESYDEFVGDSIDVFKKSFSELLINYNSYKEQYIFIKLEILEDKMKDFVKEEDYWKAADMRDMIKKLENKLMELYKI